MTCQANHKMEKLDEQNFEFVGRKNLDKIVVIPESKVEYGIFLKN